MRAGRPTTRKIRAMPAWMPPEGENSECSAQRSPHPSRNGFAQEARSSLKAEGATGFATGGGHRGLTPAPTRAVVKG